MKTDILEGNTNDRPNYDVTNDKCRCDYRDYPPTAPSAGAPKIDISPVKRLKMHNNSRLNYDVT